MIIQNNFLCLGENFFYVTELASSFPISFRTADGLFMWIL